MPKEIVVALHRLEGTEEPAFRRFLESNRPLSYRIEGAIAESNGGLSLWVDDLARPSICVHRAWARLSPLGAPEAILVHLGDLEALAAEMKEAGEKTRRAPPEGEGDVIRLNALLREARDALAAKRRIVRENGCGLYTLEKENFTPFAEGPQIGRIWDDEIGLVSKLAEYGEIEDYISERILRAPHAAVRIDGELAAYMIVHDNDSIGMLHTVEKFRNRNLGRYVASALAEMQMARGRPVYCYIIDGNTPSQRVFGSLGFRRMAEVSWVAFERGSA